MTSPFIRLLRRSRLFFHFVAALATVGLVFPFYSEQQRNRAITRWARKLLAILHVRIKISGAMPEWDRSEKNSLEENKSGCTIVANHISWLDIFLIHALRPARFVAKSEIRDWPLVGWLCANTGTLFIERARRHHTAKINEVMRDVVKHGGAVGLFPEGTTTRGEQLKKLHSSLFQSAVESNAPLIPIGIRYTDSQGNRSETPAYVDDMTLMQSICQITAATELRAILHFGMPISTTGKNRRELTLETEDAIASLLYPAK